MGKELSLEEIHAETLVLMERLDRICERLNINYFITYGSLIGVMRHKGFIPWDDDLDIGMLREEFDVFCDYCHSHESDLYPYKLVDRCTSQSYPFTIPRFCDMRYKLVSDVIDDIDIGLFIDVYPFDGLGNNPDKAVKKVKRKRELYLNALYYQNVKKFEGAQKGVMHTILRYILYVWSNIKGREYFLDRMEKLRFLFPSVEESDYVGCVIWDNNLIPKKKCWCEKTVEADFENIKVKIPIDADAMLRCSYGDYMEYPSLEQQKPTHEYKLYRL